ncbi:unnamed protein product [Dovyalis caffra]|uniref:Uncharacterized protein n=1 Tax=Dovyalis caffra TaxID=77055 RepID=A0AAV1S3K0_9ROSI|nr:unnamed protein product [Dovyalis caffra]
MFLPHRATLGAMASSTIRAMPSNSSNDKSSPLPTTIPSLCVFHSLTFQSTSSTRKGREESNIQRMVPAWKLRAATPRPIKKEGEPRATDSPKLQKEGNWANFGRGAVCALQIR